MGKFMEKLKTHPIGMLLLLNFASAVILFLVFFVYMCVNGAFTDPFEFLGLWLYFAVFLIFIAPPIVLTAVNILFACFGYGKIPKKAQITFEIPTLILGALYSLIYVYSLGNAVWAPWTEQLYNEAIHSPISPEYSVILIVIFALAAVGYCLLRFLPSEKQPPLVTTLSLAALYAAGIELILWAIQLAGKIDFFTPLVIFPLDALIILYRIIRDTAVENAGKKHEKFGKMWGQVNNVLSLPLFALIALIPVLGIVTGILVLFGQEPDVLIKTWTETADWNFSMRIAPQNIIMDEHYLCTVAAGGHQKIVKPIRYGKRHGHRVIVNRQLCVANAFEELIQERTPRFHRALRGFYDKYGFPVAKLIRTKTAADVVYFVMKPLEWLFLVILYLFDPMPENRIAVQYPHSTPPEVR